MKGFTLLAQGFFIAIVCAAFLGLVVYGAQHTISVKTVLVSTSGLSEEKLSILGDYYMNQDVDPSGPYDLVAARYYYTAIIEKTPTLSWYPYYQVGRIDFLENKLDAAIAIFKKQIELFPDSPANVYYMLGLTYGYSARAGRVEDWANAEKYFKENIARAPRAVWPRIDLGWVLFTQGKFEDIKPLVTEGLTLESKNPWLHNMYGLALLNTNEKEKAHTEFLLAQKETKNLTPREWGNSYPGNDPIGWEQGLAEMQKAIDHNVQISLQGVSTKGE